MTLCYWFTQHALNRPSVTISGTEYPYPYSFFSLPLGYRLSFSIIGNRNIRTSIIGLFYCCGPSDVPWRIVTFVIGIAINGISHARVVSHFCIEFFKRLKFTADAPRAISMVVFIESILAPLFYLQPRFVHFAVFAMNCVPMFAHPVSCIFSFPTAATFHCFELRAKIGFDDPALADSNPFPSVGRELKGIQNKQFFNLAGRVIRKDRHGTSPHDVLDVCAAAQRGTERSSCNL